MKGITVPRVRVELAITERPLVSLSSSEQALEAVLQTFTDANFVLTPSGVILDYKASDASLPYTITDSIRNKKIKEVFSPELADKLEQALRMVERTGSTISLEYVLPVSGREYWFDARLIPVSDSRIMLIARDITESRKTEIRLKRQIEQLSILRSIDLAIVSGLDLNPLLSMLLDRLTALLHIDAAAVFLLNPKTNLLEFASGKGFRSNNVQYSCLRLGEGCTGRVALERKIINVPDIRVDGREFDPTPLFRQESFVAYWGAPLIAKGRVLGVLEMFNRSPLDADADFRDFLAMVAGQAAIAIDSAKMSSELQRSNVELGLAYDASIEGLSRALNLRDHETKEHTFRVTNLTVKLAARLGVDPSALIHIRRGAILHDIGKVTIPDQILFKPGPLTQEEWEIMRRHPIIAVELLSPVSYLEPALEIPHWHHEKWDGTGYPDGLYREEIPFAARVFALADVYDALSSRRPYRPAWEKGDAVRYIRNEAGKHFDPGIVPEFLDMIKVSDF